MPFYKLLALGLLPLLAQAAEPHEHQHQANPVLAAQPGALPGQETPASKYVCPMHPHIVRAEPGSCPICGMTLEAVAMDSRDDGVSVTVPSEMQQNLGVRTAEVRRGTFWRYIETAGEVRYDETQVRHVHARATGWVEELAVKVEGEPVKKGQLLYRLYAPELVAAQDDFLQVFQAYGDQPQGRGKRLLAKARQRLRLLGLDDGTIAAIERRRESFYTVPVYSPMDGILSKLNFREGMYVDPGLELMTLVDLSRVWVLADVFTDQHAWVRPGISADIQVPALGIATLEGELDYLYPELDESTRALKARFAFPNPDLKLRPNMLVDVKIYGGAERDLLLIPEEALIITGSENRVIVRQGEQFQARTVQVDKVGQGDAVILSGLMEGEEVVTSGQFLIDAEASLKAAIQRLGQPATTGHQHH
ncbi:efflux RND transporter periplasmic adaptor subunit [Gallaecimonas sp. GXIMD4217]|uniref:efflux RND transporter periplasmic adaptor subunit n=1 Tax=Gallaecimonas sp. GXIMD4217 TaxID=3131927 RepID=UPI00311ADD8D